MYFFFFISYQNCTLKNCKVRLYIFLYLTGRFIFSIKLDHRINKREDNIPSNPPPPHPPILNDRSLIICCQLSLSCVVCDICQTCDIFVQETENSLKDLLVFCLIYIVGKLMGQNTKEGQCSLQIL